ncbi:hypothetical protein Q4503_05710 [Colwellia sp. 6_MG-2023]|uniref:hypothetical protein n=1 Tax=Colwellia sp. 6_MG-2023 TaxID=3062676 RepID=UPI0026E285D6|nr:hypothetical protein [Colwellia sp. 6_MG-2023]MDO6487186.1 hypothetical protein [Colwellia sp. 6_MG-2023]
MNRIFVFLAFIFTIIACKPVTPVSTNDIKLQPSSFVCLASQSQCRVSVDTGHFDIQFSQVAQEGKIKTELPFYIQLHFDALGEKYKIQSIASYLEGKSMFMGKIPVFFKEGQNNGIVAESLLANCSEDVMTWRLWFTVKILIADKVQQQDFFIDFDSQRL